MPDLSNTENIRRRRLTWLISAFLFAATALILARAFSIKDMHSFTISSAVNIFDKPHWTVNLLANLPNGIEVKSIQYRTDRILMEYTSPSSDASNELFRLIHFYSDCDVGILKSEAFNSGAPDRLTIEIAKEIVPRGRQLNRSENDYCELNDGNFCDSLR